MLKRFDGHFMYHIILTSIAKIDQNNKIKFRPKQLDLLRKMTGIEQRYARTRNLADISV